MSEYTNDEGTQTFTQTTTVDTLPTSDCAGSGELGASYCQPPPFWCTQHGMIEAEDHSCVPLNYYDEPCTEDMDCWDCETMGNLICGPIIGPAPTVSQAQPDATLPITGGEMLFFQVGWALLCVGGFLVWRTRHRKANAA